MRNRVIVEKTFEKPAKHLAKRYPSLPSDLLSLLVQLESNAMLGNSLGGNLRKVRLAIKSKGKGKSGGARVIIYVYLEGNRVHLLTIYDKSERENISHTELETLVKEIRKEE